MSEILLAMKHLLRIALLLAVFGLSAIGASEAPGQTRGYYMTFMRMPTFGLAEWKQMIDCIQEDGGNTLLLWTAGAFKSKNFPITWEYNRTHKNIETDFVRDLIDYAHSKGIQVLLCLTPYAYDGANQYPLEHPELKARQKNGQPANFWGMHSWGYNLCASKPEAQRFMFEYAREMFFDFYPNADGLMIESSDYAICYCPDCREKYFDNEFQFVRKISDAIWATKTNATIFVYPHYFTTRKVPGFDVPGASHPLDPRWSLFFTPHSAHIETNLIARARESIYSNEGLSLGTPEKIREAARLCQRYGLGYVPSLEPMTCPPGPPSKPGARLKPFHFEWLDEGAMPLNEPLIRVNRIAYREYTKSPQPATRDFEATLGRELFGGNQTIQTVADLLRLQETWFSGADWMRAGPYVAPEDLKKRAIAERWPDEKLAPYRKRILDLQEMAHRHENATDPTEREVSRIANLLVRRWGATGLLNANTGVKKSAAVQGTSAAR